MKQFHQKHQWHLPFETLLTSVQRLTGTSKLKVILEFLGVKIKSISSREDPWITGHQDFQCQVSSVEAWRLSHCLEEGWLGKDGAEPRKGQVRVDGGEGGAFCR